MFMAFIKTQANTYQINTYVSKCPGLRKRIYLLNTVIANKSTQSNYVFFYYSTKKL